jgi:hypothetical protein
MRGFFLGDGGVSLRSVSKWNSKRRQACRLYHWLACLPDQGYTQPGQNKLCLAASKLAHRRNEIDRAVVLDSAG